MNCIHFEQVLIFFFLVEIDDILFLVDVFKQVLSQLNNLFFLTMNKFLFISLFIALSFGSFAQKKSNTLQIATYNLRLNTSSDGVNAWPNRKEWVKSLIKYYDFDIFGTQEGFYEQITDILELPEYAYIGGGRDDGQKAGEHSAIIYKKDKFSLLDSGNFWLRETPETPGKGWDATCCNRICSWAKFKDKSSRKDFYLFNVHFDHQGVIARRESGKLMVKKMQEIAKNATIICTGDFNSVPETEQIISISNYLKDSFLYSLTKPYGPIGTFNGFKIDAPLKDRIDYIFVSKDIIINKYAALNDNYELRYPSDHLPVLVNITLNK